MRILLFILAVLCLWGCVKGNKQVANEDTEGSVRILSQLDYPLTIHLKDALTHNYEDIFLSTFVDSIEYIPLKLKNNFMRGNISFLFFDEHAQKIILSDFVNIVVTDRNGEFLTKIGREGQGPAEYVQIGHVSIDVKKQQVYVYDGQTRYIKRYDYNGTFLGNVFRNNAKYASSVNFYNDSCYITQGGGGFSGIPESILKEFFGYALIDTLSNFYDNSRTVNLSQLVKQDGSRYSAYVYGFGMAFSANRVLLNEAGLSDTIYTISDNTIIPRYLFDYGDEKPDITKLYSGDQDIRFYEQENYIFIMDPVYETSRYVFTRFSKKGKKYILLHDKVKGKTFSVSNDKDPNARKQDDLSAKIGLYNDIDGGIDLYPKSISTQGSYWVVVYNATDFKELIEQKRKSNPDKIKDSLVKLAETINDEDDHIVILMKLKDEMKEEVL